MANKGTIIYLNGLTSSGKTSIVKALRAAGADFYYLSDDIFEDNVIDIEQDAPDYWDRLAEAVFLMHKTACLFSDYGKTVVVDSMLVEIGSFASHYSRVQQIYADYPLRFVEVFCPLDICRQRNLLRGDRYETQSQEQATVMAQNVHYDLHLDTSRLSPTKCAAKIIEHFLI